MHKNKPIAKYKSRWGKKA
uniref:Uncharacterized protein n=1 Tax=Arundo donax TaxID=35708 RepID=A0A0A8ZNY0_ARUDO